MAKLVLIILFSLALGFFALQNPGLVNVRFLLWQSSTVSLAFLVILAAAAGAILTLVATLPMHYRKSRELSRQQQELDDIRSRSGL